MREVDPHVEDSRPDPAIQVSMIVAESGWQVLSNYRQPELPIARVSNQPE